MDRSRIIKGDELQIFIDGYCPLYATSHTISLSADTVSRSTKDDGFWGSNEVGKLNWEITAECLYTSNDFDLLFDAMINQTRLHTKFAKVRNYDVNGLVSVGGNVDKWIADTHGKQGYVCITSLQANANTGENATFSITFSGQGAFTSYVNDVTEYIIEVKYNTYLYDSTNHQGIELFNSRATNYIASVFLTSGSTTEKTRLDMVDNRYPLTSEPEDAYIEFHVIDSTVPEYMFNNISTVDEVYLSNNMNEIKKYAFADSDIIKISYSENLMKIKEYAFYNCYSLSRINYTNNKNNLRALEIGDHAFSNCVNIGETIIGAWCTNIGNYAFDECLMMTVVHIGDNIVHIGNNAFSAGNSEREIIIYFEGEIAPTVGTNSLGIATMLTVGLNTASDEYEFTNDFTIDGWGQYTSAAGVTYITN